MYIKLAICLFIGLAAGLGAGFAGISAAIIISPVLIAVLNIPAYEAVGLALAVDVFSSAASGITFINKGNTKFRENGRFIATALVFTAVGSFFSSYLPDKTLGSGIIACTLLMGVKFLIFPEMRIPDSINLKRIRLAQYIGFAMVGIVCGLFGAGGGMMFIILLTALRGYDIRNALGTSLPIMTLVSFMGAGIHMAMVGGIRAEVFMPCMFTAIIGAKFAAFLAHKISSKTLNRLIGGLFFILTIILVIANFAR